MTLELNIVRIILVFIILLLPTSCMGGTLPLLVQYCTKNVKQFSFQVSILYGINTLGAAFGAFLCGFILLSAFGVYRTELFASMLNIIIGFTAIMIDRVLFKKAVKPMASNIISSEQVYPSNSDSILPLKLAFYGTFFCGFCALALEILWTRSLVMILGSTIYSFSTILFVFLTGIAFGSLFHAWKPSGMREDKQMGIILILLSFITLAVIHMIPYIPTMAIYLNQLFYGHSRGVRLLTDISVSYILMLLPAFLFGIAFPLAGQARNRLKQIHSISVGEIVGLNTIGCILGALSAGFILIPSLGLRRGMLLCSFIMGVYGIILLYFSIWNVVSQGYLSKAFCITCVFGLAILLRSLPNWDYQMFGGFMNNLGDYVEQNSDGLFDLKEHIAGQSVIFYKEGKFSTVAVIQSENVRALNVNGKVVASDNISDIGHEKLLGHLPCMLHPNPKSVLVVGLGTGITLGAVELYPEVEQVKLVEIESAVLDAARLFSYINYYALDDNRLQIIIQDGRNYLKTTNETFDIITADPIHPWNTGSTYLYTKEYYSIAKQRLNQSGIMCQWLPLYELSLDNIKTIIATFSEVYEHIALFQIDYDTILIGSSSPIYIDVNKMNDLFGISRISNDLNQFGINNIFSLLSLYITDKEHLRSFLSGAVLNTDDNLYLELSSPYSIASLYGPKNLKAVTQLRRIPSGSVIGLHRDNIPHFIEEWEIYKEMEERLLDIIATPTNQIKMILLKLETLRNLRETHPESGRLNIALCERYLELMHYYKGRNLKEAAIMAASESFKYFPQYRNSIYQLALLKFELGDLTSALVLADKTIEIYPVHADAWLMKGAIAMKQGNQQLAESCYKKALDVRPGYAKAHLSLGLLYSQTKKYVQALEHFQHSLKENPRSAQALCGIGNILMTANEIDRAVGYYTKALSYAPNSSEASQGLGIYWREKGNIELSEQYMARAKKNSSLN